MSEDPITFDLAEAITGQSYPKHKVLIPLDREAAGRIKEIEDDLRRESNRPKPNSDILAQLNKDLDDAKHAVRENSLVVTVQGLTRDQAKRLAVALDEVPAEVSEGLSGVSEQIARGEYLMASTWIAHIVEIANGKGQTTPVTQEAVEQLAKNLPNASQVILQRAIDSIEDDATHGYERAVQDLDF